MPDGPEQHVQKRVGTIVRDKYRIDAFIATGSMASVYSATHRNGSRVALKILHPDLAGDPSMAERFRRESYFANAIGHRGIVRAIDDDTTDDGSVFIVMELLDGENLEQRRQRLGGRVPLPEVLQIADVILDVLSAAHHHGVLHRDLKPANVFITLANEVKLLDFGVARFNDGQSSSDMTGVGMVLGTPAFMPPEQALGRREEVDARSDIWGVGATLFTVLTGESVHRGGDARTKLIATAQSPARSLHEVAPHMPRAVASVIDRALAFDKAHRWTDASSMREALRWARLSLEHEVRRVGDRAEDEPASTLLVPDEDLPTLAGRAVTKLDDHVDTRRLGSSRSPLSEGSMRSSAPLTERDAPPLTERDAPPETVTSKDFTSSQRDASSRLEGVPATERMLPERSTQPLPPEPSLAPITQPLSPAAGSSRPTATSALPVTSDVETTDRSSRAESSRPDEPGPLLATIVPRRSRAASRAVLVLVVGLIAVFAGYAGIARRRATSPFRAAAAGVPTMSSPVTTASAAPSTVPAPTTATSTVPTPAPSVASATPSAIPSASAAPASSTAPKKHRSRPRRQPSAQTAAEPRIEAAKTAEPTPSPAPAPPPNETPPAPEE